VRQYVPYFSSVLDYEEEGELVEKGVSIEAHYDPLRRRVRVVHPQGKYSVSSTPSPE
jgi:hypothetical protein